MRAYTRQEAMLRMRDGVRLHAVILRPVDASDAPPSGLPFLLARTPYGVNEYDTESVNRDKPELAASGYIFVYEDIRGRYQSEGKFVMNRPIVAHNNKHDVDETTDTHDTIDWLLKNVAGNDDFLAQRGRTLAHHHPLRAHQRREAHLHPAAFAHHRPAHAHALLHHTAAQRQRRHGGGETQT